MPNIYKFTAMSTPCELIFYHSKKAQCDAVASEILSEVKRLEKKYNYYAEDSFLSQINRRIEKRLDDETQRLLQRASLYYAKTDGVFDITVATIKEIYMSAKNSDILHKRQSELLPYTGCEHFSIKKGIIRFDNPYTKIDLGGFVKEYAVDRSAHIARRNKIHSLLINYGGDIYALGSRPDKRAFRIGIKDPLNPKRYATFVEIADEALTTSASYERGYNIAKERFSHILSKQECYAKEKPNSVTVISNNCVESGVYSTSLMINPHLKVDHRTLFL